MKKRQKKEEKKKKKKKNAHTVKSKYTCNHEPLCTQSPLVQVNLRINDCMKSVKTAALLARNKRSFPVQDFKDLPRAMR